MILAGVAPLPFSRYTTAMIAIILILVLAWALLGGLPGIGYQGYPEGQPHYYRPVHILPVICVVLLILLLLGRI